MKSISRINKLKQVFSKYRIGAFLVSCEPNVSYLSGYTGTESYLLLTPNKKYFLTDFRYMEQAKKEARGFEIVLRDSGSYADIISRLCTKNRVARLGVESNRISLSFYRGLSRALKSIFLVKCVNAVEDLRLIKDSDEILNTKKAIAISAKGVHELARTFKPGMREIDIQAKLEYDTKKWGSQKPAFDMIVACGPNSSQPHAISGSRKVSKQDLLLVDMGVVVNGYHSDLTRCFFTGKIPRIKQRVYDIVRKAQELGIKKVAEGVSASDIDKACRDFIVKKGYGKFFGHSTGHGVGLEIHEGPGVSGLNKQKLKAGMIITVEPGIYLPNQFGVRIEDMVLVKNRGCEVLTRSIPKIKISK